MWLYLVGNNQRVSPHLINASDLTPSDFSPWVSLKWLLTLLTYEDWTSYGVTSRRWHQIFWHPPSETCNVVFSRIWKLMDDIPNPSVATPFLNHTSMTSNNYFVLFPLLLFFKNSFFNFFLIFSVVYVVVGHPVYSTLVYKHSMCTKWNVLVTRNTECKYISIFQKYSSHLYSVLIILQWICDNSSCIYLNIRLIVTNHKISKTNTLELTLKLFC